MYEKRGREENREGEEIKQRDGMRGRKMRMRWMVIMKVWDPSISSDSLVIAWTHFRLTWIEKKRDGSRERNGWIERRVREKEREVEG